MAFLTTVVTTSVATSTSSEALAATTSGTLLFVAVTTHSVTAAASSIASHSGIGTLSGEVASLVASVALSGRHGRFDSRLIDDFQPPKLHLLLEQIDGVDLTKSDQGAKRLIAGAGGRRIAYVEGAQAASLPSVYGFSKGRQNSSDRSPRRVNSLSSLIEPEYLMNLVRNHRYCSRAEWLRAFRDECCQMRNLSCENITQNMHAYGALAG